MANLQLAKSNIIALKIIDMVALIIPEHQKYSKHFDQIFEIILFSVNSVVSMPSGDLTAFSENRSTNEMRVSQVVGSFVRSLTNT